MDLSGPDVGDAVWKYFIIGSFTWPADEAQKKFFDKEGRLASTAA